MNKKLFLLVFLAGCATSRAPVSDVSAPQASEKKAPVQAKNPHKRGGGYYLDDGPGDNIPENLDAIADAVPRWDPIKASTSKPYVAFGKSYTPYTSLAPYREEGVASWYGKRYNGQKTASGEIYDMFGMTAAHPILPIPSYAKVSANGKSVIVRINDRGPFHSDRLIDLSYTAAYKLGIVQNGSSRVVVESIVPENIKQTAVAKKPETHEETALPVEQAAKGIYLQLGAFSGRENAEGFLSRIKSRLEDISANASIMTVRGLFKVNVGPYQSRGDAEKAAERIAQALEIKAVIVK